MSSRVGVKGNIVIDKELRDQLGVQPGWETVQLLRDGHLEIHFLPPVAPGGSAGILQVQGAPAWLQDDEALHMATERAFGEALAERYAADLAVPTSDPTA